MVAKYPSVTTISSISRFFRRPRAAASLLTIALALAFTTAPAATAQSGDITLTLVRHAQSAGNASGLIDTSTPGPDLTELGRGQALAVAAALRGKGTDYDGIYASTMIRTQETAQPMADALHEPIVVLPGLREIEAGIYEGSPEAAIADTYFQAPQQWLRGDRDARIPGSVDGNEFDARFDEAVQTIYDDTVADGANPNVVAYSHGAAIMMWVAMNVPGVEAITPLQNTGYFVIRGNPRDGWTLLTSRTSP
jgi:broad specificity phosphatase PhoE